MIKNVSSCFSNIVYKPVEFAKKHPWLTAGFLFGVSAIAYRYLGASISLQNNTSYALVPRDYEWVKERAAKEAGEIVQVDKNTMIKTLNAVKTMEDVYETINACRDLSLPDYKFYLVRYDTGSSHVCQSFLKYGDDLISKLNSVPKSYFSSLFTKNIMEDCSETLKPIFDYLESKCKA